MWRKERAGRLRFVDDAAIPVGSLQDLANLKKNLTGGSWDEKRNFCSGLCNVGDGGVGVCGSEDINHHRGKEGVGKSVVIFSWQGNCSSRC